MDHFWPFGQLFGWFRSEMEAKSARFTHLLMLQASWQESFGDNLVSPISAAVECFGEKDIRGHPSREDSHRQGPQGFSRGLRAARQHEFSRLSASAWLLRDVLGPPVGVSWLAEAVVHSESAEKRCCVRFRMQAQVLCWPQTPQSPVAPVHDTWNHYGYAWPGAWYPYYGHPQYNPYAPLSTYHWSLGSH